MISISHLSIHFGGKYLFDDVSFLTQKSDRIGLVGKNGAGKSTLLKIIAGEVEPEDGVIARPNGSTVGYLPQDGIVALGKTVYDETATAFHETIALEVLIHKISDELMIRTDYESEEYDKLLHQLADANDRFHFLGGGSLEGDIERILTGLGFTQEDMTRLTDEFSGGWQMRIELAKILLRKPDCILLDEPTNHLDIESIEWLENFLSSYDGAVVLVSHDRTFLDKVTNRTIEITLGKIEDYPSPYSRYVELRKERRTQQESAFKNQQREIAKTEEFIERFRYKATKAVQVQSRIKMLDRIDRIEIDDEDLSSIHFHFPDAPRSGAIVVDIEHLTKRFDDKIILRNVDLSLDRGDRVAFVGKNGEGKSTLSKIIAGLESYEGACTIGYNVRTGYYAQHQAESLDGNSTVFEIIDNAATGDMRTKVRSLLGAFLFSGDDAFKKVKVLSGGEKSRLALAKLLLDPVNLLILDEPTNHLDMRAKDVLKKALLKYEGALIVVSHDRDFLQGLTNKVVEFKGGSLKEYAGDIQEFLRIRKLDSLKELEVKTNAKQTPKEQLKPIETKQLSYGEQQNRDKEVRKVQRQLEKIEEEIAVHEKAIAGLEEKLAHPEFFTKQANPYSEVSKYEQFKKDLAAKMEQWSQTAEQLEKVKK